MIGELLDLLFKGKKKMERSGKRIDYVDHAAVISYVCGDIKFKMVFTGDAYKSALKYGVHLSIADTFGNESFDNFWGHPEKIYLEDGKDHRDKFYVKAGDIKKHNSWVETKRRFIFHKILTERTKGVVFYYLDGFSRICFAFGNDFYESMNKENTFLTVKSLSYPSEKQNLYQDWDDFEGNKKKILFNTDDEDKRCKTWASSFND